MKDDSRDSSTMRYLKPRIPVVETTTPHECRDIDFAGRAPEVGTSLLEAFGCGLLSPIAVELSSLKASCALPPSRYPVERVTDPRHVFIREIISQLFLSGSGCLMRRKIFVLQDRGEKMLREG